jgi:hypothetical protein
MRWRLASTGMSLVGGPNVQGHNGPTADVNREQSPGRNVREGTPTVAWAVTPETDRWLDALCYGAVAVLGGITLLLVVGTGVLVGAALRDGSWMVVLGIAAVAVLALSRPPVLAALRAEETSVARADDEWHPSGRGAVVAALVGGVAVWPAADHSVTALSAVLAAGVAATTAGAALTTRGEIDGEAFVLETDGGTAPLAALSGVRSRSVGPVVLYFLSYARGTAAFGVPRLLTVPQSTAPAVETALAAGVDAPADADPISPGERAAVALFALGLLAVGPAFWLLATPAGQGAFVAVLLGGFSSVVAVPLCWYALTA